MATDTICLAKAQGWISTWLGQDGTFTDHKNLRAFTIPLDDLKQLVEDSDVTAVRGYIGIDSSNNDEPHLILVGIDKNGKDIIKPAALGECTEKNKNNDLDTGIYDFSQPCPTTCDTSSPLYVKKG